MSQTGCSERDKRHDGALDALDGDAKMRGRGSKRVLEKRGLTGTDSIKTGMQFTVPLQPVSLCRWQTTCLFLSLRPGIQIRPHCALSFLDAFRHRASLLSVSE